MPQLLRLALSWVLCGADSLGGGFVNHKKSRFRRLRFEERMGAEGLALGVFLSQAVAHERLDVHLHILERCRAMNTSYCLIMEDFVHWNRGELVESLKVAMQLPRWDVAVLGRNENQIRCDDIDPTFDRFSRLTCSPLFNYAVLVHRGYYSDLMDMFQAADKEVCGYHTDIYFATEKLYRIPSNAFWFIASPLPVQLRSHLRRNKGDFAARCRLGLQSAKPIVMLHPMRTGGTSVCDIAAEWYPMGGRGGGGRIQNCRANPETDLDMSMDWGVVPKEPHVLYSEGDGFVALEPSFTDWEDGHNATLNRSQQRDRWYQAVHSSGFWTNYLTVLLVRDPIERYLSWLRFCTPTCLTNVSEENPQAVTAYHHDCYRLGVSKFIQLLFQPRVSRSTLAIGSTLKFEAEERMFTTGCRGYHKQYHLSQASNCLTRHLLRLPSTPTDSHLTTALDVLERFDVVMDLTISPNESSTLLQDALRRNIHCGHHCDLLRSLPDLMMPHSHNANNARTREPLGRSLSSEALQLLEEQNRLDRALVAKAHQLIRARWAALKGTQYQLM